MRKIYPVIILLLITVLSCVKETPDYHSYGLELKVQFPDEVPEEFQDSVKLVFNNLNKAYSYTAYTDSLGYVSFEEIEPGFYSATATHSYGMEGNSYYLNGLKNLDIFVDHTDSIKLVLSKTGALVIKEFYYSACLTPAGKQYSSDQFVEIYNNSDMVQYVDGLTMFEHESYALENNYWEFLVDTIVGKSFWSFPGNGTDYPLEPGKSVVIARDGINHQDSVMGNPLSPVNLSHADFEYWIETPTSGDIDGPIAVNMIEDHITFRGSDFVYHTRGGSAIALIKIPGSHEDRYEYIRNNYIKKTLDSDRDYVKIPVDYVIDAVEVTWDEAHAIYKRFPLELDAGYTYTQEGSKSGKCIRRKIKEVINGRVIYQDTNNSTEDFLKNEIPNPWVYE